MNDANLTFRQPGEDAREAATRLLAQNTANRGREPLKPRTTRTLAEQRGMAHDPVVRLSTSPVDPQKLREADRRRAADAGLVSGESFRRKLGLSFSAFKAALQDGLIPPPLCERRQISYWLKEVTDEAAFRLGR
jgi:hypothetical protein